MLFFSYIIFSENSKFYRENSLIILINRLYITQLPAYNNVQDMRDHEFWKLLSHIFTWQQQKHQSRRKTFKYPPWPTTTTTTKYVKVMLEDIILSRLSHLVKTKRQTQSQANVFFVQLLLAFWYCPGIVKDQVRCCTWDDLNNNKKWNFVKLKPNKMEVQVRTVLQ